MFDTGTTGFMLIATALVMLMTPGLAFFYGGLARRKNVVGMMAQSFVSLGITAVMWFICGYSLCFSGGDGGIIGDLNKAFMRGVDVNTPFTANPKIPEMVFVAYQLMFAVITPALISGAFTSRVKPIAYLVFLVLWQLLVYYPLVHMVWGGGWLAKWGVLDFAGGTVVHGTAGAAALASVIYIGRRRDTESRPNSIPLIAIGAGLLWFGWFGFNAGSELNVDGVTAQAFVNTNFAAAFAGLSWLAVDWIKFGKPRFVGFMTGAVAGLTTVTPASGFVSLPSAVIIGVASGIVCYLACALKNKMKWDDALDVWGIHGVGGALGMVLLGVFASKLVNAAGADGLTNGGTLFFAKECIAAAAAAIWGFAATYMMLAVISMTTRVRVTAAEEAAGDASIMGESGYDDGAF